MQKNEYYKMFQFENDYWWYRGLHELVRGFVKKQPDPLNIFDAGCGTGRMMEMLLPFGTVSGLDYSEDAVTCCHERGLNQVKQGDLNRWQAEPESLDIIISNDVICTSGVEDDMAVISQFFEGLKKDGLLILNLPAFKLLRRRHDIAVFGKRRYRKYATLKQLKKLGFKPVSCSYRLPHLFFFLILQKFLVEPFQKSTPTSDLHPLPKWINTLFLGLHRLENKWITAGLTFPFGSSLFLVLKKEEKINYKR